MCYLPTKGARFSSFNSANVFVWPIHGVGYLDSVKVRVRQKLIVERVDDDASDVAVVGESDANFTLGTRKGVWRSNEMDGNFLGRHGELRV